MGDNSQVGNVDGVGVAIGAGASVNIYGNVHYYPIRTQALLREAFKPLIDNRSQLFGGRARAFEEIAEFIQSPGGGYLVVTAPAGFGKTALLANLVSRTPDGFAYHFFAPLYGEDTLSELFFLRNVVEQMARWHDHDEELPTGINDLRALYQHFVDEPLARTQVLVIDGLDEVSAWRLEPYLSRLLPAHLHVIVSVRDLGQDWARIYGFPSAQVRHLPLGGLSLAEVADVLRSCGPAGVVLADDEARLAEVYSIVAHNTDGDLRGDPFYARYLAEDVRDGLVSASNLDVQPRGLEAYLDSWWQEIRNLAGDAPTRDLFGTMAAALGPIGRQDLEALNPSLVDDWAGDFFEEVIARVRRQVTGNAKSGYALAHPRLRTYLADARRIGRIEDYRKRLLGYCANWRYAAGDYPMNHLAGHLAQAGDLDSLYRLFDGEWIGAQWLRLGSYGRLVADLDLAVRAHQGGSASHCLRGTALAVARQTARELILGFPNELLEVLIRLGHVEQVLAMLDALNSAQGATAEPLGCVARALLLRQAESRGEAIELAQLAAGLLVRVVNLVPRQRGASAQLQLVVLVAEAIEVGRSLGAPTRKRLAEQTLEHLAASGNATLHAVGLGRLATALLVHEEDRTTATQLLASAWPIFHSLAFPPDQVAALSNLLPAVQRLTPADSLAQIERMMDDPEAVLQHASLLKNPLLRLIEAWRPADEGDRPAALALLERLAYLPLQYPDYFYAGMLAASCCRHLLAMGLVDRAQDHIERLREVDPMEGARAVMEVVEPLHEALPNQTRGWLEEAVAYTDPGYHPIRINRDLFCVSLASGFAMIGDWDRGAEILSGCTARKRNDGVLRGLRLAGRRLGGDPKGLAQRIDVLLALVADAEPELQAKSHAVAADVLADCDQTRSRQLAAVATALCLEELPEGDTDELRNLQAHAHHLEGDSAAAARVAGRMKWISSSVRSLIHMISVCGQVQTAEVDHYGQRLLEVLRAGADRGLFGEAVVAVAANQRTLMQRRQDMAHALDAYLAQVSLGLSFKDQVGCLAALAASVAPSDGNLGDRRFRGLLGHVLGVLEEGYGADASVLTGIYREAALVAQHLDPTLLEAFDPLRAYFDQPIERLRVDGAHAVLAAAFDCRAAEAQLGGLLDSLDGFRDAQPDAYYLSWMFADITGSRVGIRIQFVDALRELGATVADCARHCPETAQPHLAALLPEILSIQDSPNDLAQGLVDLCGCCGSLEPGTAARMGPLLAQVVDAGKAFPADLARYVVVAAVAALLSLGQIDQARSLVEGVPDDPLRGELDGLMEMAQERQELGALSPFEEAFVNLRHPDLAVAVLHAIRIDHESMEVGEFLCASIAGDELASERVRLLNEFIPLLAAPLLAEGGAAAIAALADEIEAFDGHFQDAARRVARVGLPATSEDQ